MSEEKKQRQTNNRIQTNQNGFVARHGNRRDTTLRSNGKPE